MEKPIEIKIKEFEKELIELINNKQLSPFIIRPILEKVLSEIINQENIAYNNSLEKWNEYKKGEKND